MGIGRKLKSIKKEKDGDFSLVRLIEKQLSKPRPSFSLKTITHHTKNLLHWLKEKDLEQFFFEFNKLWQSTNADHIRVRKVFHPSELMDACPRKLYYDISETPMSNPDANVIPPQLQMIFDQGSWIHLYIQGVLHEIGILKGMEVRVRNEDLMIDGRADALIEVPELGDVVVEIKSINEYGFSRLKTRAKTEHIYQASIYAKELGVSHILFLYWNKNNCALKEFLEPVNEDAHKDAVERITEIKTAVEEEDVPDRACIDKFCERALTCVYHSECFSK